MGVNVAGGSIPDTQAYLLVNDRILSEPHERVPRREPARCFAPILFRAAIALAGQSVRFIVGKGTLKPEMESPSRRPARLR